MITTLIFDWGGVLTTGRYTKAILETLATKRHIDIDAIYDQFDGYVCAMMAGDYDFNGLVERANAELGLDMTAEEMKQVFKDSIHVNEMTLELIEHLKGKVRLIMLSDNDPVTVENFKKCYPEAYNAFEKHYFSYQYKIRKPDLRAFQYVIADAGLNPEECAFIDDKEKNTKAAEELGMTGITFVGPVELAERLEELGVEFQQ